MKQRIFCVLNTHTLAGVTIYKKPEVFLVLLSVGETIVDWPVFCGVGIINYLSLFCTTSSFKIRNTKKRQVSSHAPKITDNRLCVLPRTNPGLFPLSSSLEVKRNWDSCKNQIIRKTPSLKFCFSDRLWVHHSLTPLPPLGDVVPKKYLLASILLEIQHCSGWEGRGRLASFTIIIR